MFEYSAIVYPIEIKPEIDDATGDEVAHDLTLGFQGALGVATQILETARIGEGWEIASHDVVTLDRHLLISFLLRRQT